MLHKTVSGDNYIDKHRFFENMLLCALFDDNMQKILRHGTWGKIKTSGESEDNAEESAQNASDMIKDICLREGILPGQVQGGIQLIN